MVEIGVILNVLLYTFGIILLIVLIILGIRMFNFLEKADRVLEKIDRRVDSLDNFFMVMDKTTSSITTITDKISFSVISLISRLFSKKKRNKEDMYE
ncbi:MAG: hypothetical protein HFJ38_02415 [Bacilli bacterium]|nr:hypothetical protein [Bacilli bacterium]